MIRLKKIICFTLLLVCTFSLFGCASETEKNWNNEGAWREIYVYKGKGDLLSMNWDESEKKGSATINNTKDGYAIEYIKLYEHDSNYKADATGLPSSYSGNAKAFSTIDDRIWLRIIWSDTATFLLVRIYE